MGVIKTDDEMATELITKLFNLHKAYEEGINKITVAKEEFSDNSKGAYSQAFSDLYNMLQISINDTQQSIAFLRDYLSNATNGIVDTDRLLTSLMDVS